MDRRLTLRPRPCRRPRRYDDSYRTQRHEEATRSRSPIGTRRKASPEERAANRRTRRDDSVLRESSGDRKENIRKRKASDESSDSSLASNLDRRRSPSQGDAEEPCSSVNISTGSTGKRKRKAADDEERPTKRTKSNPEVKEKTTPKNQSRKRKATDDGERPSPRLRIASPSMPRGIMAAAVFEAKYQQLHRLGAGGCGCVYAGYRRADHLPVAIKHISKESLICKHTITKGVRTSVEVAIMLKLSGAAGAVELMDWYDVQTEIIVVMERPTPAVDLLDYINSKGGRLQEDEAKVILRQLVDAAKTLEDQEIFHRDIKVENILIETGSDTPRVRLIDFGLSCFFKKRSCYRVFYGTTAHVPPEWHSEDTYRAGPTTAWQMGVVLFDSLHQDTSFATTDFLNETLEVGTDLSELCRDFLMRCLATAPRERATLEELQRHPWLM